MPLQKMDGVDAPVEKVYGGCGPYGHRGPWGGCRRGGQWGGWGWRRPYWRRW
ncbi:GCG_CRPN prefix-to-repeats domain-containing protein [Methylocystis echinoides]|uniref:GCG_CRPN prefix-to-repeats domain-containing protein n=1 Tax=Methylocystis echinoides TaxID=29468 RepID=UPI0038621554